MSKPQIEIVPFLGSILNSNSPDSAQVTECAAILANTSSLAAIRSQILQYGCLQLIMRHMNTFFDIATVQTEICAALANLAIYGFKQRNESSLMS
jgi:hypothetical protein